MRGREERLGDLISVCTSSAFSFVLLLRVEEDSLTIRHIYVSSYSPSHPFFSVVETR